MADTQTTFATIDIGTNTTLLLVARARAGTEAGDPGGGVTVLEDRAEITRLGRGIGSTGQLGAEGIAATLAVLRDYVRIARQHGARIAAIGTEGLRRAANASAFLQPAREVLGTEVEVIDGAREAALTFRAVTESFPALVRPPVPPGQGGSQRGARHPAVPAERGARHPAADSNPRGANQRGARDPAAAEERGARDPAATEEPLVVVDIGGGSTEIIVAEGGVVRLRASLPLGSVRLAERYIRSDPPTDGELDAVRAAIAAELGAAGLRAALPHGADTLVGVAGTVTSLAAMAQDLATYDPARVHGFALTRAALEDQIARLAQATQAEREAMAGLDPRRADVILPGALILRALVEVSETSHVVVSDRGIRWGLLYEALSQGSRRS